MNAVKTFIRQGAPAVIFDGYNKLRQEEWKETAPLRRLTRILENEAPRAQTRRRDPEIRKMEPR